MVGTRNIMTSNGNAISDARYASESNETSGLRTGLTFLDTTRRSHPKAKASRITTTTSSTRTGQPTITTTPLDLLRALRHQECLTTIPRYIVAISINTDHHADTNTNGMLMSRIWTALRMRVGRVGEDMGIVMRAMRMFMLCGMGGMGMCMRMRMELLRMFRDRGGRRCRCMMVRWVLDGNGSGNGIMTG